MGLRQATGLSSARIAVALATRPQLWAVAIRLAAPKWWRRWPPLPLPPPGYLAFRIEAMYGRETGLDPEALINYLEWCRTMRRVS